MIGNEDLAYIPIEKLHEIKYVCGKHFHPRDFNSTKSRLKTSAVPSLFLNSQPLPDHMLAEFPCHIATDEVQSISSKVGVQQPLLTFSEMDHSYCHPTREFYLIANDSVRPIEASDKNIGVCTESPIEVSDKNIGAVPESPTSCSQTVDQDESDEEQSDEDGCNPAVSTWINKLQIVGTTHVTQAPIQSSDDNVKKDEQCKQHESDDLPTYPAQAREEYLEAEDQGSAEQIDDYTDTHTWVETKMECVEKEKTIARCCACLCSGSQLTPLDSIEIVVRPGLTRHLDTLYTELTGLTVPECVGGAAICVQCVSRLTVAYMFKLQCVESHAVLTSSSTLLPPPAHHRQQSAPGSPEGWPPSQDESATHKEELCLPKKEACPTRPVATASPDVNEPSGTVNTLSSTSHSSTETKPTLSVISISEYNKRWRVPDSGTWT